MTVITFLDYLGVFVFAISGILAASEKQLDLFGGFIIAFVTALGGGTLRDLLLDVEIVWISQVEYLYIVVAGGIFALVFKTFTKHIRKTMFLFDTIGISLFTILGVQKSLAVGVPVEVAIIFGAVTATFGGVIRDILCNEIPLIFRQEIYATACIAGAITYSILHQLEMNELVNTAISGSIIIAVRTIAVIKKLRLPLVNDKM